MSSSDLSRPPVMVDSEAALAASLQTYDPNRNDGEQRQAASTEKPPPILTILVVNTGVYDLVTECLRSIRKTVHKHSYEIILIDNCPHEDRLADIVNEFGDALSCIRNSKNIGFPASNNRGFAAARGHHVLLLNPDTIALPNTIDRLLEIMELHPEVGMLGCQLLNTDGTLQTSAYNVFPSLLGALLDSLALAFLWRRVHNVVRRSSRPVPQYVKWLKGACLLVRRDVLTQIGLMEETYFLYLDDADWCFRARKDGWKVAMVPSLRIIHHGGKGGTGPGYRESSVAYYYESYLKFVNRYYGRGPAGLRILATMILLRVAAATRLAAIAVAAVRNPEQLSSMSAYWRYVTNRHVRGMV